MYTRDTLLRVFFASMKQFDSLVAHSLPMLRVFAGVTLTRRLVYLSCTSRRVYNAMIHRLQHFADPSVHHEGLTHAR